MMCFCRYGSGGAEFAAFLRKIFLMTLPCPALTFIPQRPPFVLVDVLLEVADTRTVSAFTIPADHVLCEASALSAEGLVENMAQTAAAGAGYRAVVRADTSHGNNAPQVGFIGAVKGLTIHRLPAVGEQVTTSCEVKHVIGSATIVACEARGANGEALAACELTIFLQE